MKDQSGTGTGIQGCKTTRIYCLQDCPAGRRMKPENRVHFLSREEARARGYRPCKVCRPDGEKGMVETWFITHYNSPMGRYALISSKRGVVLLKPEDRMGNRLEACQGEGIRLHDGKDYHRQVATELDAYFSGRLRDFSVPLDLRGTDFQRRVWDLLLKIPYGETRTYGQIARALGDPKAGRAVGHANGRNPVSIIVPCHRVIGVKGKLVGYGGGLDRKKALIDLEARFRG